MSESDKGPRSLQVAAWRLEGVEYFGGKEGTKLLGPLVGHYGSGAASVLATGDNGDYGDGEARSMASAILTSRACLESSLRILARPEGTRRPRGRRGVGRRRTSTRYLTRPLGWEEGRGRVRARRGTSRTWGPEGKEEGGGRDAGKVRKGERGRRDCGCRMGPPEQSSTDEAGYGCGRCLGRWPTAPWHHSDNKAAPFQRDGSRILDGALFCLRAAWQQGGGLLAAAWGPN